MFISLTAGIDLARLARRTGRRPAAVGRSGRPTRGRARLLALFEHAPCDVGRCGRRRAREGPVLVPFAGRLTTGRRSSSARGWRAAATRAGARGAARARPAGRQSAARPRVDCGAARPRRRGRAAPRRSGARRARRGREAPVSSSSASPSAGGARASALPARARDPGPVPLLLVRRGVRPGGLAPRGSDTRFTWTITG